MNFLILFVVFAAIIFLAKQFSKKTITETPLELPKEVDEIQELPIVSTFAGDVPTVVSNTVFVETTTTAEVKKARRKTANTRVPKKAQVKRGRPKGKKKTQP